jgi:hypothetical protein
MRILRFFSNKIAFIFFFTLFLMIFSRFLVENIVNSHSFQSENSQNTISISNASE